jgi:choline dehydrogenase-like flavoprotein
MAIYNHLNLHDMVDDLLLKGHRPPDLDDLIEYRAQRFVEFDSHVETLPDPENRIRIDAGRPDSSGMPGIVIDFRIDEYTRAALDRASVLFRQIGQTLNAVEVSEMEPFSHHHLMGTTRMGRSHRDSVVDPDGRVHAHRNLFIAGSSVFPTGGTANPTLTIAALSLRLADAIAGELARQE